MTSVLRPTTYPGTRFVELVDHHAPSIRENAARHDIQGSFPYETFDAFKTTGLLQATVPKAFGGLGLRSLHDLSVGLSRLGRADGSVAIAANMHLVFPLLLIWLQENTAHSAEDATRIQSALRAMGAGAVLLGSSTEIGSDLAHPRTVATPVQGGWLVDGRKAFATLSPVADWFVVSCRAMTATGPKFAYAVLARGAEGLKVIPNWNALGMRASGSHDVECRACFVHDSHLLLLGEATWLKTDRPALAYTISNIGLLAAFLGIAESARDHAVEATQKRLSDVRDSPVRYAARHLLGEIELALHAMRSALAMTTALLDEGLAKGSGGGLGTAVVGDFQSAKLIVNRMAVDVVDKAMTVCGAASFRSDHPLSRLYRDVRAGSFMKPLSPLEAYDFLGNVAVTSGLLD